jgi:hypothetical protein
MPIAYTEGFVKQPRILRNLKINEVSGVDRGAGKGVKVVLMKRDDSEDQLIEAIAGAVAEAIAPLADEIETLKQEQVFQQEEAAMQTDILKVDADAEAKWQGHIQSIMEKDRLTEAKAVNKFLLTREGQLLMRERNDIHLAKVGAVPYQGFITKLDGNHMPIQKLDGNAQGFKPDSLPTPSETQDAGGKVHSRTENARHGEGHPQPFSPYDFTARTETGDGALARYRAQFMARRRDGMGGLAARAKTFEDIGVVQLSAADVLNEEAKAEDALVAEQRSAERDANQLRGPMRDSSGSTPGSRGRRGVPGAAHNGSNQSSLGVNSTPNRSM